MRKIRFIILAVFLTSFFLVADWPVGNTIIGWWCHNIDVTVPKRPLANPPGEGTEDGFPTLDFDKTTDESVFTTHLIFPTYRVGDSIKLCLMLFVDNAPISNIDVVFGVEYKMVDGDSIFDFVNTKTVLDTISLSATNKQVHATFLYFDLTGFTSYSQCLMRIYRDADNAADNYDNDARINAIEFGFKGIKQEKR